MQRCASISDLRALARRRLPGPVFDYVEGGADEELSLVLNLEAFRRRQFVPINPRDVTAVDPSSTLFERRVAAPLICSPTGYTRMMQPGGEAAVARAAARAGVPYGLSTVATSSIEEIAATGHPDLWFQLYVWSLGEIALKPSYWVSLLRSPPIRFANSPAEAGTGGGITIEDMTSLFEPGLTWQDVAALREHWAGALVVKGSLDAVGAREALAAGADGVHLSNHGGRQLDRVVPPIEVLAEVRDAVGERVTVIVDSGIRSGADLAIAVALGADAGGIGRAYLYGLMAGGEAGVDRALGLIRDEFVRTLQLLGVRSVTELRACGGRVVRKAAARVGDPDLYPFLG